LKQVSLSSSCSRYFSYFHTSIKDVLHYSNKLDYGDIDLVAACKSDQEITKEKIQKAFGCQYISKNSCVYSFDYKNVQVDLAVLNGLYDFHSYYIYSCYSPIGNVVGRLIKQKGLKWGIDGLSYPVKLSDSEQLGQISILYRSNPYDTFERVLQFLGIEYDIDEFFKNYFADQEDIFEWLASSELFNKDIFVIKNLTAIDENILGIKTVAGMESNYKDLNISSWNVTKMEPRKLIISI
jgi:hypothetical protein